MSKKNVWIKTLGEGGTISISVNGIEYTIEPEGVKFAAYAETEGFDYILWIGDFKTKEAAVLFFTSLPEEPKEKADV